MVMRIQIVKVALFVRVVNGVSRISLRSKDKINVSKIAANFGGGGHINAAGFSIDSTDIQSVRKRVLKEILETTKE